MCLLPDCIPVKMDIFRWRKKRALASKMDARFGDPSISAPTQGSWNEMPRLRSGIMSSNKAGRLKSFLRSEAAESSDPFNGSEHTNFPRHPLVDMQNRQRSASAERVQGHLDRPRNGSRPRKSSSPKRHKSSPESLSESDKDEEEQHSRETEIVAASDPVRRYVPSRSRSQEDNWRIQPKDIRRNSRQSIHHKSPPLSATAMMRRHSSQSESTRTYSSTPSTATFSSQRTSMTTPGLPGFSGSFIPPPLKEEEHAALLHEDVPPVPPIPVDRLTVSTRSFSSSSSPPSASRSAFRDQPRSGHSNKRRNAGPVGPQELVPSNDELWGY